MTGIIVADFHDTATDRYLRTVAPDRNREFGAFDDGGEIGRVNGEMFDIPPLYIIGRLAGKLLEGRLAAAIALNRQHQNRTGADQDALGIAFQERLASRAGAQGRTWQKGHAALEGNPGFIGREHLHVFRGPHHCPFSCLRSRCKKHHGNHHGKHHGRRSCNIIFSDGHLISSRQQSQLFLF